MGNAAQAVNSHDVAPDVSSKHLEKHSTFATFSGMRAFMRIETPDTEEVPWPGYANIMSCLISIAKERSNRITDGGKRCFATQEDGHCHCEKLPDNANLDSDHDREVDVQLTCGW